MGGKEMEVACVQSFFRKCVIKCHREMQYQEKYFKAEVDHYINEGCYEESSESTEVEAAEV